MKYILTPDEIREADIAAMSRAGLPSSTLVENAARGTYDLVLQELDRLGVSGPRHWMIFCGPGNNGADGYALGRIAASRGDKVFLTASSHEEELNEESLRQRRGCNSIESVNFATWPTRISPRDQEKSVIVVDALLGVGQRDGLKSPFGDMVSYMNGLFGLKVAVDIATGLNPDSGRRGAECFEAALTPTMGALKLGHLLHDGPECSGRVTVVNLGVPDSWYTSGVALLDQEVGALGLPDLCRRDHKYDRGRLLAIAGSEEMPGAAALVSTAAIRSGVGLVNLITGRKGIDTVRTFSPPEIIALSFESEVEEEIHNNRLTLHSAEKCSAQLVGPGLGKSVDWLEHAAILIDLAAVPLILDADGLTPAVLHRLDIVDRSVLTVLSPHYGEAARISSLAVSDIEEDPVSAALSLATEWRAIVVLKGAPTVVAHYDGRCWINQPGNPGMATAGSGDVLTGLIGGMIGSRPDATLQQQLGALLSAVWVHSRAGDIARKHLGSPHALHATDIVDALPDAIAEIFQDHEKS